MSIRSEQKEKTRQAIIQAALRLSEEKGYPALSLREVTREADIAPATFYRHFKDMEELGLVLVDKVALTLRQLMRKARQRIKDNGSVIESSVITQLEFSQKNPQLFRLLTSGLTGGPLIFREALQKEKQFFVDELIEDLSNDERLANIPMAAELMVNQVLVASIEAIDKKADELVQIQQRLITQLRMILLGSMAQNTSK
ncbi:MAG TPA: HTH-type transcriptional repressor FabR [Oceanospirillales bacterium]|jgi:AcrR family transcriptional regulator|nr:HTH-type transcriptional repressor FabR [Oleispira sp.]HCM06358.1 HTH-type transcriptional repressor FabR [Oceanospirillales bacterium]|tara:strand:- start:1742 stop:2338 length:597 start_codon:yes stop_codon:yes gene_type:complete